MTKLKMNCKPHLDMPKKEIQDLGRRPTKDLELAVRILEKSIVVAAINQVMVAAKSIGKAFACPDLPIILASERGNIVLVAENYFMTMSCPLDPAPKK